MLLMVPGRVELMLQCSLRYDGMCVCSSVPCFLSSSALCGTCARDNHSRLFALRARLV